MTITTTYEKVSGRPMKVGIGVRTQLRDPQRAFMVLPPKSRFPQGYVRLRFDPPHDLKVEDGLVSLDRKSTRLNSSHSQISYAVFCLKKKKPSCLVGIRSLTSVSCCSS